MSQYYYLSASLPLLSLEDKETISRDEFLERCETRIKESDLNLLLSADLKPPRNEITKNKTLKAWNEWERALRNALVKIRASSLSMEPEEYFARQEEPTADRTAIENLAREAVNQGNPLSVEEFLINSRWNYLNEISVGHYFDIDSLIIYYLQLQLILRKKIFEYEKGKKSFKRIYEQVSEKIRDTEEKLEESLE